MRKTATYFASIMFPYYSDYPAFTQVMKHWRREWVPS